LFFVGEPSRSSARCTLRGSVRYSPVLFTIVPFGVCSPSVLLVHCSLPFVSRMSLVFVQSAPAAKSQNKQKVENDTKQTNKQSLQAVCSFFLNTKNKQSSSVYCFFFQFGFFFGLPRATPLSVLSLSLCVCVCVRIPVRRWHFNVIPNRGQVHYRLVSHLTPGILVS